MCKLLMGVCEGHLSTRTELGLPIHIAGAWRLSEHLSGSWGWEMEQERKRDTVRTQRQEGQGQTGKEAVTGKMESCGGLLANSAGD